MSLFQQQPIYKPLQVPQGWGAVPRSGAAVAPTLIACDAWDTYGATASISTGAFGPYQAAPNGNLSNGQLSIVAINNPPWNPTGSGYYLHTVPGGVSIPNAGTGMYLNFGNPHQRLLVGFWFRAPGGFAGGSFIIRWNRVGGQTFGTDVETLFVTAGGALQCAAGTSTATLTSNTWQFIEFFTQLGTANSPTVPGAEDINVSGVNFFHATNVTPQNPVGQLAVPSFTLDNEFSSINLDFGPWYLIDPGTMGMGAALSSGGNMYFNTYLPSSNDAVQFTPSTGTNYSNVNSAPAGSAYNSANAQLTQDTYGYAIPTLGNIQGVAVMTQAEIDAPGDRIALPVWKSGNSVVTGSIGTGGALINGTYSTAIDARLTSPFTGAAFTTGEVSGLKAGIIVQD